MLIFSGFLIVHACLTLLVVLFAFLFSFFLSLEKKKKVPSTFFACYMPIYCIFMELMKTNKAYSCWNLTSMSLRLLHIFTLLLESMRGVYLSKLWEIFLKF